MRGSPKLVHRCLTKLYFIRPNFASMVFLSSDPLGDVGFRSDTELWWQRRASGRGERRGRTLDTQDLAVERKSSTMGRRRGE